MVAYVALATLGWVGMLGSSAAWTWRGERDSGKRQRFPPGSAAWRAAAVLLVLGAAVIAAQALTAADGEVPDEVLSWLFQFLVFGGVFLPAFVVCAGLLIYVAALGGAGVVGFGRVGFGPSPEGLRLSVLERITSVGAIAALVGLLCALAAIPALGSYDSPAPTKWWAGGRGDILPLWGVVRESVTVTNPTLLHYGQVCWITATILISLGWAVWFGGRALSRRRGGPRADLVRLAAERSPWPWRGPTPD
ncbi:MAG: hypothetical protein JWM98_2613 [Thermoleophilia bacterium]|nr:hypothetical protein [Thermoleophilia bacterium]